MSALLGKRLTDCFSTSYSVNWRNVRSISTPPHPNPSDSPQRPYKHSTTSSACSPQHPSCSIIILRMWHNKNHCDPVEVQWTCKLVAFGNNIGCFEGARSANTCTHLLSPKLLLYITYNYKFFYRQTQKFSPARTSKCQGLRWHLDSEADTIGSRLLRGQATGNHKVWIPQGMDPLQKRRAGLIDWFCIGKYGGGIQGYEKNCVSYLVTRSRYSRWRQ